MITLRAVRKVYPGKAHTVTALDGIDLHVERGAIHGIVGPSGAGKSTLVRCLTGLEQPTSGTVSVAGTEISGLPEAELRRHRRRIGMVFQDVDLFEARTAAGNIELPLKVARVPRARRAERVAQLLELVGLADRGGAYPAQLSGGQRQRIGIARALAAEPDVLLCDEPTSALDPATTRQLLELIAQVRADLGVTVLIITHEMSVVRQVCDSVSLLAAGRIVQSGPIGQVAAQFDEALARELIPLAEPPIAETRAHVEVSYSSTRVPTKQVLALLADLGDVTVATSTIETLGGQRVGRFQLDVPAGERAAVIGRLRDAGLYVDDAPRASSSAADDEVPQDAAGVRRGIDKDAIVTGAAGAISALVEGGSDPARPIARPRLTEHDRPARRGRKGDQE